MNCKEFTESAAAWLDGELAAGEKEAAAGHLAGCEACARLVEDLAAGDRAVAAQPAAERAETEWTDFNRRLMVRIAMGERSRAEGQVARSRRMWRRALRLALVAAALLVAAWAGWAVRPLLLDEDRPGPGSGPVAGNGDDYVGSPVLAADREEELERLLAAAESILVRLKNADPKDREELAAIRAAVIDSGLPARLAELRRSGAGAGAGPTLAAARSLEMVLVRVANHKPSESEEFKDIQDLVLDNALVERTRALRASAR